MIPSQKLLQEFRPQEAEMDQYEIDVGNLMAFNPLHTFQTPPSTRSSSSPSATPFYLHLQTDFVAQAKACGCVFFREEKTASGSLRLASQSSVHLPLFVVEE